MSDGQKPRLTGQGGGGAGNGPSGDLYLTVRVQPHPLLRREGRDLLMELPITISEALLGARVEVPTLRGNVTVTIPRGSDCGQTLRLRGKGVPAGGGRPAGHLYLKLAVRVPDPDLDPDAAVRAAAELDALYKGDPRAAIRL